MSLYKGSYFFDNKKHPGELSIDNDNRIYLTINESSISSEKHHIIGVSKSKRIYLSKSRLVDHDIGYYKLKFDYVVIGQILNQGNYYYHNHIKNFKFSFEPLAEWLGFNCVEKVNDSIKFNLPDQINVCSKKNLCVYIKYEIETSNKTAYSCKDIYVRPYINVELIKPINIDSVRTYIQMITRFFAFLIGFTGNVNSIKYRLQYKDGDPFGSVENTLIINTNFANNSRFDIAYKKLRTTYNDVKDKFESCFNNWIGIYKKYYLIIIFYFSAYRSILIEDVFLGMLKCLEGAYDYMYEIPKLKKVIPGVNAILDNFYSNHKQELVADFNKIGFDKKYIKHVREIHGECIESIIYGYSNRIDLADKIRKLDNKNDFQEIFDKKHVEEFDEKYDVYKYLRETRNHYTHLNFKKTIIKDDYFDMYIRKSDKIFTKFFLELILKNKNFAEFIISHDDYLTLYDKGKFYW